jgi:hypothetical protein
VYSGLDKEGRKKMAEDFWSTERECNFIHGMKSIKARIRYYYALLNRDIWDGMNREIVLAVAKTVSVSTQREQNN